MTEVTSTTERLKARVLDGYDTTIRPVHDEGRRHQRHDRSEQLRPSARRSGPGDSHLFLPSSLSPGGTLFLHWDPLLENISWIKTEGGPGLDPRHNSIHKVRRFSWSNFESFSISMTALLESSKRYVDLRYDGTIRQSLYAAFVNLCNMDVCFSTLTDFMVFE
ncbi:unnamed protein product [Caenorhabditis auriculariae]|uniref:Uncharacterized protein n=1 Tax=Caenorhabditis auriculariae TaxID=2777116 RepID=A0A8S1GW04_9PELO|nr:unnamed protein product [Caenorhabditis auriculariae]